MKEELRSARQSTNARLNESIKSSSKTKKKLQNHPKEASVLPHSLQRLGSSKSVMQLLVQLRLLHRALNRHLHPRPLREAATSSSQVNIDRFSVA